jgi:hypothetical protein
MHGAAATDTDVILADFRREVNGLISHEADDLDGAGHDGCGQSAIETYHRMTMHEWQREGQDLDEQHLRTFQHMQTDDALPSFDDG